MAGCCCSNSGENLGDLKRSDWDARGGNAFNAEGLFLNAPILNHLADGVVGNGLETCEGLVGNWARQVSGFDPRLYALAVVRNSSGQGDRIFHEV